MGTPPQQRPIPSIGQWGYPHEEKLHLQLQGHWRLCYLSHVFPFPMWAKLYISLIESKKPCRPWCSSPPSLAAFTKCLYAVLQNNDPRFTHNVHLWLECLQDHPVPPPRNSASIAVLHPVTPEWCLLPGIPLPNFRATSSTYCLSMSEWGRPDCVCGGGGSLTVTLWLVSSVEITMDSNSEGSEGNLSPVKEDVYYGSVARRRIWRSMSSEDQYGMWCSLRWQFNLKRSEKAKNCSCTQMQLSFFCAGQSGAFASLSIGWIKLTGDNSTGHFSCCWRMKFLSLFVLHLQSQETPTHWLFPFTPPYPGHSSQPFPFLF